MDVDEDNQKESILEEHQTRVDVARVQTQIPKLSALVNQLWIIRVIGAESVVLEDVLKCLLKVCNCYTTVWSKVLELTFRDYDVSVCVHTYVCVCVHM